MWKKIKFNPKQETKTTKEDDHPAYIKSYTIEGISKNRGPVEPKCSCCRLDESKNFHFFSYFLKGLIINNHPNYKAHTKLSHPINIFAI